MDNYPPENPCTKHPAERWTWDGYCWICIGCESTPLLGYRSWSPGERAEWDAMYDR